MTGGFDGRRAVVTGAAGGIGRATARRLLAHGADVLLVDRDESGLGEALDSFGTFAGRARVLAVDVTDEDDVRALALTAERAGGVDILFNNAGVPGPVGPMLDCSEDDLRAVLEINVVGVWRVLRRLAPLMAAGGGGSVINSGSTVGIKGAPMVAAYGASKQAVLSITRSAAVELAHAAIRVNAICPGPIETAMTDDVTRRLDPDDPGKVHDRFAKRTLLRRFGQPDEVAALVVFLASDEAAYITGATYLVDGGEVLS